MGESKCFLISRSLSLSLWRERMLAQNQSLGTMVGASAAVVVGCSSAAPRFVSFLIAAATAVRRQQIWPGEFRVDVKEEGRRREGGEKKGKRQSHTWA